MIFKKRYILLLYTLSLLAASKQVCTELTVEDIVDVQLTESVYIGVLKDGNLVIAHLNQSCAVIIDSTSSPTTPLKQLPAEKTYTILQQAYSLLNQPKG